MTRRRIALGVGAAGAVVIAAVVGWWATRTTAMSLCLRFETGDIAHTCEFEAPKPITAAAVECVRFSMRDRPESGGLICRFETEEHLRRTLDGFTALDGLFQIAARDRFVSSKAKMFVRVAPDTPDRDRDFIRDTVNHLWW